MYTQLRKSAFFGVLSVAIIVTIFCNTATAGAQVDLSPSSTTSTVTNTISGATGTTSSTTSTVTNTISGATSTTNTTLSTNVTSTSGSTSIGNPLGLPLPSTTISVNATSDVAGVHVYDNGTITTSINGVTESFFFDPNKGKGSKTPSGTTSSDPTLTVNTDDMSGNTITGIYIELQDTSGNDLATGYSPVTFSVKSGQQYILYANNYRSLVFDHWDDGSTNQARTFTISKAMGFTAFYSTGSSTSQPSPITINNVQSTSGTVSSSPFQITLPSFNAGSSANQLLVVGIHANSNYATSVTFGGTPMIKRVQSFVNNDAEFWFLKNPSGTGDIVVTMAGSTSAVVGAYSLSGVNETTPVPSIATNTGSSVNPHVTITTKYPGSLVLDLPSIFGSVTLGSPACKSEWNVNMPNAITGASSSTAVSSPGTVTCSWTASSSESWDNVGVEVHASSTSTSALAPQPPTGLAATAASSSQINLSWTAPSNTGGSAISGYKIERINGTASTWSTIKSNTGSTATTYSDTGLQPDTSYTYRVSAINSAGTSLPSNTASAITTSAGTSGSASLVQVQSGFVASDSLTNETKTQSQLLANPGYWNYQGDAPDEGAPFSFNRDAQGLHIAVQAPSSGTWAGFFAESPNHQADLWSSLVINPVRTTTADFYENGMYVQTANGLINYVTCTTLTNKQDTVWTIISVTGNQQQATNEHLLWMDTNPNQALTKQCNLITNGNNYVKVYLDGIKVYENHTLNLQMPAPFNAYLEPETDDANQMLVGSFQNYFVALEENIHVTNLPSNAVTVELVGNTGMVLTSSTVSAGAATLDVGKYIFPLAATIKVLDSSNSVIISSPANIYGGDVYTYVPPSSTAPQPPTGLAATAASSSQINLSWTAPSNTGGSAISGYKIERINGTASTWSTIKSNTGSTATTYSDTGLQPDTSYTYRVSAINGVGTGLPSNNASAITNQPPPTSHLEVTSQAMNGNALTGFFTTLSTNGSPQATGFTPADFTLNDNQPYSVHVSDFDWVFDHWLDTKSTNATRNITITSNTTIAAVYNHVPQPPTGLAATAASSSQINLSWTAPSPNGGSSITGYEVERATGDLTFGTFTNSSTNTFFSAPNATTFADTGLQASTTYNYTVFAKNSVGPSAHSNTVTATTKAPPVLGIVINNVQSTSGTVSSSPFQITLPSFNAGSSANQLLVVGIHANSNYATSVTFGGTPMIKRVQSFVNNDAEFWYLKNPSGTGNIVVTMNGATSVAVGAYSLSGANQTTPLPTVASNTGSSVTPNISLTTKYPGSLVLDLPSIWGGVTLGSPTCTQEWNMTVPSEITGASSSTKVSTPGTATCGWTASGTEQWDDVAVELHSLA